MIKVLYFASLREQLELASEHIELPKTIRTVGELRQSLCERGQDWAQLFNSETAIMMSVNQSISAADATISEGDEIAFFPPVTGG